MHEQLTTVARFGSAAEAGPVRSLLEEQGIRTYLGGATTADTLWHVGTALGGVEVQVASGDVERALQLLGEEDDSAPEKPWTCPACGESVDAGFSVCWKCGHTWGEPVTATPRGPVAEEPEPVNTCPMCGAGLADDAETCDHCGESLAPHLQRPAVPIEDDPDVDRVEDEIRRIFRSSVLGLFLCPPFLNVYSLAQWTHQGEFIHSAGRGRDRRLQFATMINAASILGWGLFYLWLLSR